MLGMYWVVYRIPVIPGPLYEFNEQRDARDILAIFERDRYWLLSSDDYSPKYMLEYKTPSMNSVCDRGKLKIKVLREHDEFVGFVAYYMKTTYQGIILFVAVKNELRGKRYAEKLVHGALLDLKTSGARYIRLVTRVNNTRALNLYKRLEFNEIMRDDTYVYFERQVV
jgi:ribosomal protein S18 acetylase RimI-like enzyme